ncbi:hypothetical protein DFJ58DRAFT_909875 [Suillus subalutaceus]|uniref:uncharacterized protein n=1 Tax=Suillus subalutaceus TaxID=48586 RepID=UPI001B87B71D|nr:uncharacterized protein DFJ58DRAFT_909875 [Suillus subalutaceus]KAG1876665.1 hypothetical protein DFJ58DRAFT_909875 [Suillus subalutaceus]
MCTAITAVPIAIRIGTAMVATTVIGAIVAALVVAHLITGGAGATPGILLGVVALARIMMVLQALVRQAPPTGLKTVVVGDGSTSSCQRKPSRRCASRGHLSRLSMGESMDKRSFVQAQVIEEVHGGHPPASLKLAIFSLLPYLEKARHGFRVRYLRQKAKFKVHFILDYLPVSVPLSYRSTTLFYTINFRFREEWRVPDCDCKKGRAQQSCRVAIRHMQPRGYWQACGRFHKPG